MCFLLADVYVEMARVCVRWQEVQLQFPRRDRPLVSAAERDVVRPGDVGGPEKLEYQRTRTSERSHHRRIPTQVHHFALY